MPERLVNIPAKVEPSALLRVQAEADNLGTSLSAHVRTILDEHFQGRSVESVRDELQELAAAVATLNERGVGGASSESGRADQVTEVLAELNAMRSQMGELMATLEHVLRIVVFQLEPSPEAFAEMDAQFGKLRKSYRAQGEK